LFLIKIKLTIPFLIIEYFPCASQENLPSGNPPDLSSKVRLKHPDHVCFMVQRNADEEVSDEEEEEEEEEDEDEESEEDGGMKYCRPIII
jgi:hypothetical protein